MNFGEAIEAAKIGKRITREGTSQSGVFLMLVSPLEETFSPETPYRQPSIVDTGSAAHIDQCRLDPLNGNLETIRHGWLPSQFDVLGEDWSILD